MEKLTEKLTYLINERLESMLKQSRIIPSDCEVSGDMFSEFILKAYEEGLFAGMMIGLSESINLNKEDTDKVIKDLLDLMIEKMSERVDASLAQNMIENVLKKVGEEESESTDLGMMIDTKFEA